MVLAGCALGGLLVGGCSVNPATGERQLRLIGPEQEIAMGQQSAPDLEKQFGGKVEDAQLQAYVNTVGQRVASKSDLQAPYQFTLVKSDVANAFALPGGPVFITAGLMSKMQNERELAAVLAHEVAHVAAGHSVQQLQRQMGAEVLASLAGAVIGGQAGQAAEAATKIATGMANLRYSRDQEAEADSIGIRYLAKAGYNPWGMVEMLTALKSLETSEPSKLANFFQTHPMTSDRIAAATKAVQKGYPQALPREPDPNGAQFEQMRQRLLKDVPAVR